MDAERFDAFLRVLTSSPSRRAAIGALGGLGLVVLRPAQARKRKKKPVCPT
jgi:hypothetical protein